MTLYYKAVRPDGTDFRTGTVDYAALSLTGGSLPPLPKADAYACCTSGVYHAADTPAETLIGGAWPCRLFVVTGKPLASEGHKFGFRTLKVVGELEAWQALGPNGRAVAEMIGRAKAMTPDQATAPHAAWTAARGAARDAACYAARGAAWYAARGAAWCVAGYVARGAAGGAAGAYAAGALVVRDLITPAQFDVLYGPWASVMGGGPTPAHGS